MRGCPLCAIRALARILHQIHQPAQLVAATRQPNTPGVTGSGTLLGVVIKALAPGATNLSIVQVNAKDSQQKPVALLTGEATIQVK